jgi:hypothetical protein
MTIGHTYRLRTVGTLRGSKVEFGVHLRHDTGTTDAAAAAAHWVANMLTPLASATSSEVNWDEVIMSDTDPDGEESFHTSITQPFPGVISGDCLPGQNAMLVSLSTGQKGRRRHGRLYLPGVSESSSANGRITGTQLTAVGAFANALENFYGPSGTLAGWRLVIYSPVQLTPPKPKPFKPKETELVTPVRETRVDDVIRTQRRRAIGVGR